MTDSDAYGGHNLVFIIGSPRSGTTWLQRMLASHPKIRTGQESFVFLYVAPQLRRWRSELKRESNPETATGRGGVGLSCYFREDEFLPILSDYMLRLMRPMIGGLRPGELFLEKTPGHALYAREIGELLPEARFIHLVRDPRDVVASLLTAARGWGAGWAPRRSTAAVRMWLRHVRSATRAVQHIPARRFLQVRFEDLWASPESTLAGVGEFLGLPWDAEGIKNAVASNNAEAVKAGGGTPIPLYGEVAERVGSVVRDPPRFIQSAGRGAWRGKLTLWDKFVVWYCAKGFMRRMGYSWSWRDWMPAAIDSLQRAKTER